jgi:hypothetical protein
MMSASALCLTGVLGVTSFSSVSREFIFIVTLQPFASQGFNGLLA